MLGIAIWHTMQLYLLSPILEFLNTGLERWFGKHMRRFDVSVNQLHQLGRYAIHPPVLVFSEDELAIGALLFFAFLVLVLRDKGPR